MSKVLFKTQALIFDMDGVITNTMPDHFRAWKIVLGKVGIVPSRLDIYLREGQPGMVSIKELLKGYHISLSRKKAEAILREKEELFEKHVHRRFITGARPFVRRARQKKIKLALVTGTSRREVCRILPDSLLHLFDVVVTGNDVLRGKPDPEPFLKAVRELDINRRYGIVFENAPFGIQAARAAGLKCIALETSLPREYLKGANRIFSSFKEMKDRIRFEPVS